MMFRYLLILLLSASVWAQERPMTKDAPLFSHLSEISAKNQRVLALRFVPDWSIKVTPKGRDGLSRSVKHQPLLERCAAITYAVSGEASAQLLELDFVDVFPHRRHNVESHREGAPSVFK